VPFTLAHPAAVLPIRGLGLPMTALVVGSMAPDVPRIAGRTGAYQWTHSAWGVVTVDVALGALVLLLWFHFYRRPLVDLCPERWRSRLAPTATLTRRAWMLSLPALAVGAATHVVWDAFTHEGAWGVRRLGFLQESYAGLAGYTWAQYVFGAVGLVIVVVVALRHLAGLPAAYPRGGPLVDRSAMPVVLGCGVVLGLGTSALVSPWGFEAMAFYGVLTLLLVVGFGATSVCAWWHVKRLSPAGR
jgi:hypothetical protein